MSVSINGTNGLVFNDASTQNTAATGFGFKNRIINGAMMIDQRNAGSSLSLGAGGPAYCIDRWQYYIPNNSSATIQQVTDAPTGFINSLKFTVGTGVSVTTQNEIYQPIEGFNVADLAWGTANAKTITLSFWVKSSLTGTFNCAFLNQSSSRSYVTTYSIATANTWTQISVTIPGDTTGTWLTNNSVGLIVAFSLGQDASHQTTVNTWAAGDYKGTSGAVSVVATTGATWQVTGVQLEKGSTATSFDYRPYGTELQLCCRYFQAWSAYGGIHYWGGTGRFNFNLPVQMRATPTLALTGTGDAAGLTPLTGGSFAAAGTTYGRYDNTTSALSNWYSAAAFIPVSASAEL